MTGTIVSHIIYVSMTALLLLTGTVLLALGFDPLAVEYAKTLIL
jgi:hypothetical protein